MAEFNPEERRQLAKSGAAMPDGSYPIRNVSDLKNAIQAIGRAKNPVAAKAHIKKRAGALGQSDLIPEGWTQELDYVVAFAVDGSGDGGVSEPFEVLRVGDYRRGDREVPITAEDLDEAVVNFDRWKSMGQEIPVDYDHAFAEGREAPAAGWYASLKRVGDALWATVRWTEQAKEQIASGRYRFFSPEFTSAYLSEEGRDEGFTFVAGALTNRPFLRGMTPVAMSQEVEQEMTAWIFSKLDDLAAREDSLSPDDTSLMPEEEKSKESAIETFKVEVDGEMQEFKAEDIVALSAKVAKAERAAQEKSAEVAASKSQVETLSTRIESLEDDLEDRDFRELFKQAQREGRLDAKEETEKTWRETFGALGSKNTKALIEQIPAETIPISKQGRSGSGDQEAAPRGMHAENFKLNQKVEAFMAEHPDRSFADALLHVEAEVQKAAA